MHSAYTLHQGPFALPHLCLAKLMEETCGFCALTGSTTLAKYLREIPGCEHCYDAPIACVCHLNQSNDVNLFVPMFPEGMRQYQLTGNKKANLGKRFYVHYLPLIFKELQR